MDPYMQANNVHTGRCRWPPLKGEEDGDPNVYFMQLKNKQQNIRKSSRESAERKIIL